MRNGQEMKKGQEKRRQILAFIGDYAQRKGYSPSFSDIQTSLKSNTKSPIAYHIKVLQKQGLLQYDAGVARSIRLVTVNPLALVSTER